MRHNAYPHQGPALKFPSIYSRGDDMLIDTCVPSAVTW